MTNKHGQPVITLDGTAAAGKSTLNKGLSALYGARSLEYSLFFRIIAIHMLEEGFLPTPNAQPTPEQVVEAARFARSLDWTAVQRYRNDPRLRDAIVSKTAPFFGGLPEVTQSTDALFRALINNSDTPVIAEGRTVGKFIFPEADVKLYVDADIAERGARRAKGMRNDGKDMTDEQAARDLAERDLLDQTRPYQPTGYDANVHMPFDTTGQTVEETRAKAVALIEERLPALTGIREQISHGQTGQSAAR